MICVQGKVSIVDGIPQVFVNNMQNIVFLDELVVTGKSCNGAGTNCGLALKSSRQTPPVESTGGVLLRDNLLHGGVNDVASTLVEILQTSRGDYHDHEDGNGHDHEDQSVLSRGLALFVLHFGTPCPGVNRLCILQC
jgi:hypothetical protein